MEIIVASLVAIPLLLYPYLYFFQESLLFHPQEADPRFAERVRLPEHRLEAVHVPTSDGVTLVGWLALPKAAAGPVPLVIYFGGNAEEASGIIWEAGRFTGHGLLSVNYRGFGDSGGQPSETALLADALVLFDRIRQRQEIDATRIFAMGRSLGSGVAVHLAAKRPVAGAILVTPYDSMVAVAGRIYPYVPVSWLLRHRFDSLSMAGGIQAPMLALAGSADTLIPPEHAERLVAAWGGSKRLVIIPQATHEDVDAWPLYWSQLTSFLKEFQ